MKRPNQPDNTQLGELLQQNMGEAGLDIRALSETLEITYEHARRLVRGESLPSKYLLPLIAKAVKIPLKQLQMVTTQDRIRRTHGTIPMEMAGHLPTLEPVEHLWGKLSGEQQAVVVDMVRGMAKRSYATA